MTLLVTAAAAAVSTVVWYMNENRNLYRLGTLSLIFWGATLMWFVDFIVEYIELRADCFSPEPSEVLNDLILGLAAVVIGFIAWLIVLVFKDPKGIFGKK